MITGNLVSQNPLPELATQAQVAQWAQISQRTVRRLVARNEIPFVRVGGQLRFPGAIIRAAFIKEEPAAHMTPRPDAEGSP